MSIIMFGRHCLILGNKGLKPNDFFCLFCFLLFSYSPHCRLISYLSHFGCSTADDIDHNCPIHFVYLVDIEQMKVVKELVAEELAVAHLCSIADGCD